MVKGKSFRVFFFNNKLSYNFPVTNVYAFLSCCYKYVKKT